MDMLKLIVAFHNFASVPIDENLGLCTCLCGICNKTYFVTKYCAAQTQALLGFWIQWAQVRGMLHNVGGGVQLGCGPV
jgi:hypothetical protein